MRLVITSQKTDTLDRWQRVFEGCGDVVCQRGLRAETPVDAVLMSGLFALERYGGRPGVQEAQILENRRGDGWHSLIIVPPGRPMTRDAQGHWKVQAAYAHIQPAYFAASRSFRAIEEWNARHVGPQISVVEINLPLMDMDNPVDDSSPQSFKKAFKEYREGRPGGGCRWPELAEAFPSAELQDPVDPGTLDRIESVLGQRLPDDLRSFLLGSDGLADEYGTDVIWPAERILGDNLSFRNDERYKSLYGDFDSLMFFGDNGGGDQFAFVRRPERQEVFVWDHETDSRTLAAPSLEHYVRSALASDGEDWYR
ncbi:SMI1/KNR4 family protein [Streptomyces chartreusis]|uniref:SMI1/KNR4 family protein n=1 Tax=Streptomyces chartreusis TaxID=1969 RepID=UPI0033B4650F